MIAAHVATDISFFLQKETKSAFNAQGTAGDRVGAWGLGSDSTEVFPRKMVAFAYQPCCDTLCLSEIYPFSSYNIILLFEDATITIALLLSTNFVRYLSSSELMSSEFAAHKKCRPPNGIGISTAIF